MVYPKDQQIETKIRTFTATLGPQFLAPSTLTGPQFSMGARREAGLAVAGGVAAKYFYWNTSRCFESFRKPVTNPSDPPDPSLHRH